MRHIALKEGMMSTVNGGSGPTASDYIQNGLVLLLDAKENAGLGIHASSLNTWKNLATGSGAFSDVSMSGEYQVFQDYIRMNQSATGSRTGTGIGRCTVSTPITEKTIELCFSGLQINWISDSNRKNAMFTYPNTFGSIYISFGNVETSRLVALGFWTHKIDTTFYLYNAGSWERPYDVFKRFSVNSNGPTDGIVRDGIKFNGQLNTSTNQFSGTLELFNRSTDFSRPFNGKMHCMRIYNRNLTLDEMVENQEIDLQRYGTEL